MSPKIALRWIHKKVVASGICCMRMTFMIRKMETCAAVMMAITLHWGQRSDIRKWKLECGMAGGAAGSRAAAVPGWAQLCSGVG